MYCKPEFSDKSVLCSAATCGRAPSHWPLISKPLRPTLNVTKIILLRSAAQTYGMANLQFRLIYNNNCLLALVAVKDQITAMQWP